MPLARNLLRRCRLLLLPAIALVSAGGAAYLANELQSKKAAASAELAAAPSKDPKEKLVRTGEDRLTIPDAIARNMAIRTAVVGEPKRGRPLPPFQGVLALDNNSLARVRSRFAGEVVSLGNTTDVDLGFGASHPGTPPFAPRTLRSGDVVQRGQLLAVVWSRELGEKKSELVDAVSKLRTDLVTFDRLRSLQTDGGISERSVRDAERAVESDRIAVDKAERTLASWRLTAKEIAEVRDSKKDDDRWARVEVVAPRDGILLEKNIGTGDIVDTTTDLYKVGDIRQLTVWVNVYEEDLPSLQSQPMPIEWKISIPSRPNSLYGGSLEQIGSIIDPNQHTALVSGQVENPLGELKIGQSVTVTVELPAPPGELELPADAVVEDGRESVVFVQPGTGIHEYVRHRVQVVRRFRDAILVRTGSELRAGDRVVTDSSLLMRDALDQIPLAK